MKSVQWLTIPKDGKAESVKKGQVISFFNLKGQQPRDDKTVSGDAVSGFI